MSTAGEAAYLDEGSGWRADLAARLRDLLSSRAIPSADRLSQAVARTIDRCTDVRSMRSAVRDLLTRARQRGVEVGDLDRELEELCRRIGTYRSRESIENYGEYLFTVDVRL